MKNLSPRKVPLTKDNIELVNKIGFKQDQEFLDELLKRGMDKNIAVKLVNKYRPTEIK